MSARCRWVRPAPWRRNGESLHKPLSVARPDSQHLEVGAQRLRSVLSSAIWPWTNPFFSTNERLYIITWRPNMAMLSYKAKCHRYFSFHSLDPQRSTKTFVTTHRWAAQTISWGEWYKKLRLQPFSITGCSLSKTCPGQWHSWGKGIVVIKQRSQSLNSPFPSWHSSTENRKILLLWECRSGKDLLPLASSTSSPS